MMRHQQSSCVNEQNELTCKSETRSITNVCQPNQDCQASHLPGGEKLSVSSSLVGKHQRPCVALPPVEVNFVEDRSLLHRLEISE